MSGMHAFVRGLVAAAVLAGVAPLALLLLGPVFGGRLVLVGMLGAAAVVALARSAAAARGRRGRLLARQALLVASGLLLATWLLTPGLLGASLALWGFGLVLSLGALLPGAEGPAAAGNEDPFEAARSRALALLEEEP
jgi:hypothetical protein